MSPLFTIFLFIVFSMFFSAVEIALMSLNRYKVQADAAHNRFARVTEKLLTKVDKVLSVILLGNTFVNIMIGSLMGQYLEDIDASEQMMLLAPIVLTIILLFFAEVMPKTIAAIKPNLVTYTFAPVLWIASFVLSPVTSIITFLNNKMMAFIGVKKHHRPEPISFSEYKLMINEGMKHERQSHHRMMMGVLELHELTVNDVMQPRSKIKFLDLKQPEQTLINEIIGSSFSFLPVIEGDIENILGIIQIKDCVHMILLHKFSKKVLQSLIKEAYFIPEKTLLHTQFMRFQEHQKKFALVVDEYGHLQGLVGLKDILDEIWVCDTQFHGLAKEHDVIRSSGDSWIFPGQLPLHTLKRLLDWTIPTRDATTIGGALIDYMECLPQPGTSILLNEVIYEVLQVSQNTIVKIKGQRKKESAPLIQ